MFLKVLKRLENVGKISILLLAMIQIIILGIIDYYTGYEISFSVFYLVPVTMAAWYGEKKLAIIVSIISALTWQFSNELAGQTFHYLLVPFWNTTTRIGFFVIVATLLTKLKESYIHQRNMAQTDFLTGAANPRAFYKALEMEVSRSRRYHRTFSICYFDADNFKRINDTLGHNVGSNLLVKVVEITKENLRATDTIARLGGDEFAILLPETDEKNVQAVVKKLRSKLLSEMQSNDWAVTFSIGVMTYVEAPENTDEVIKLADHLMYEVKRNGKNSVKFGICNEAKSGIIERRTIAFA